MHGNIDKTYSNRSNCIAGARTALKNPGAKINVDFIVTAVGDRFSWSANTSTVLQKIVNAAVADAICAEADKPGLGAAVVTVLSTREGGMPGPEVDPLDIPTCLRRPPETEADRDSRIERNKKISGPERKLVMPKRPAKKTEAQQKAILREDGLRHGSKEATMIEMVSAGWVTEAEVCKKLNWKACMVTLRRACDKVGLELERRANPDGGKSQYRAKVQK